jgi:Ulp1 family protease
MPSVRHLMHAFFSKEVPPGVGTDATVIWSNKLGFSRRNLSRLCLAQWPLKMLDRPLCDRYWLNDEIVNAYMDSCSEQNYEKAAFHHSTFWNLMAKDNHKYNIELAWPYAKRFRDDHPKGVFKPEGLHFFPKCNDVHWYLMIVDFDKKTIFSVDSFGSIDHERDAKVMLTFFRLALLERRAATRPSSRRNSFMLRGDFNVLEWKYKCLEIPVGCQQTDRISCGLFTCMNTKEIVQDRDILLGGRKKLKKSQVNQEKAPLWRFYLFQLILMKAK